MFRTLFLTFEEARSIAEAYGTPTFVYDEALLKERAAEFLSIRLPFGFTPRYAMKANPHKYILSLFDALGLHIDASSGYEANRALACGVDASKIRITAQELPIDLDALVGKGCLFTACSLFQLKTFGERFPGSRVAIRVNPGIDAGGNHKVDTAGPLCGFGIWHEDLPEVMRIAKEHNLIIDCVHTHIGSGTKPYLWSAAAKQTLSIVEALPSVSRMNLGGGFKVARMPAEETVDIGGCGEEVAKSVEEFFARTKRRIRVELEPGTFLVAQAGVLLSRIVDKTRTNTHTFLKLDCGLTEIARPTMYGAQHYLSAVLPAGGEGDKNASGKDGLGSATGSATEPVVVIGHCCESSDLLTSDPANPAYPSERELPKREPGDFVLVHGAGAYCSAMAFEGYNSFPPAAEVVLRDGKFFLISERGSVAGLMSRER
ncbi:diaminopimelate decarboxylase [Candidatus Woesearchaeota archaeon]|nr:MAG: diaminopimelate decarboxylase [Candidatus Woesearchaeota archaeon]